MGLCAKIGEKERIAGAPTAGVGLLGGRGGRRQRIGVVDFHPPGLQFLAQDCLACESCTVVSPSNLTLLPCFAAKTTSSKSWLPRPGITPKAALFFCHGYGDTCTFFFEGIAKRIAESGYAVYAMDYPGFGLSYGLHGYIPSFDGMVNHVIEQYARIRGLKEVNGLPHFLLGQSMGGAVALKVHLKQPAEWDGVLLVAPMCKIAEDVTPPGPVLKALTLLSYVLPEAKLFPQKDLGDLAFRDSAKRKIAEFNVISYCDQMRLRTAVELIKATKDIESQLDKVSCPLLILHGAADKVTDPNVSKFLYNKACTKDKTLKLYEDGYHSILEGEPDDRISSVINDIINWLDSHSTGQ
ncbi:Caffeoylshikimate esterase [Ananas comosus]|uniref:Caffeoylshikimate esterase n=1 Tax=Ananas comosus TaxID=4615 RepID=A0A199VSZ6_ANACO|nr:Caffeoylshikimate esterase [Ananas comosus]